ncbi:LemA family protein [Balneatrix alpica]|uniref:LemA family protein n=1 Tax=Balneatrix alpica TaxID=75684 RepID=A0ABV5ZBM9_9GAMM|nr:LemA family protein [Balneatrix alpica]
MGTSSLITLAILVILALGLMRIYNNLVSKRNQWQNAFAQIEVQLKRRYDLIPNLVEVAKGYMQHERETLEKVVQARNAAVTSLQQIANKLGPDELKAFAQQEQQLGRALGQFNMVMEQYPDLKANTTMMQLSEELTSTENKVARARQFYNDMVMDYNAYRQSFPPVVLAASFGHGQDAALLEFADSEAIQQAPKVSF